MKIKLFKAPLSIAFLLSITLTLASCGTTSPLPINVVFALTVNASCETAGYSDIRAGSEVDISDSSGKIIGFSSLSKIMGDATSCSYGADNFQVPQVTDGIYRAHVGNSFRGTVSGRAGGDKVYFVETLG